MRIINIILCLIIVSMLSLEAKGGDSLCVSSCPDTYAQKIQSELSSCDVDSLGDLWIFTLDKTGSMLWEKMVDGKRKLWTPSEIKSDVIWKLSRKGGILDQINYSRDRISIMETGYGDKNKESDSYGSVFCAASSLDSSFIHVVQSLQTFCTNRKSGLKNVLSDRLEKNNYNYRESFVSQIRVLSLYRMVKLICLRNLGLSFQKIHIVTITDDADVNDQWKMDYYSIKRAPAKMKQLNALHSKYIYSSFTQKGGGYLDEREQFTDVSSKNHIYMYDYVTLQQKVSNIVCLEDSIIRITPLDGMKFDFQLNLKQIDSDSICFAYIDTVSVNGVNYPICLYMCDKLCLDQAYDMNPLRNKIVIRGKVQVQYKDSIYGLHYKSYPFVQYNEDYTASMHTLSNVLIMVVIMAALIALLYVLWLLPNRKLFSVYVSDGRQVRVCRGYRWQWDKLTPLAYSSGDNIVFENIVFAKHPCFKRETNRKKERNCINHVIIESPFPLTFAGKVQFDSTKNNIRRNARDSQQYPAMLLQMYGKTCAGRIASLQDSRYRWVRLKLYPMLNRWLFRISPHYYYWDFGLDNLISVPSLRNRSFLLEQGKVVERQTNDDMWLNTYYLGNYPTADVLICLNYWSNHAVWNVYQLSCRESSGHGIASVRHLIFYRHNVEAGELPAIKKCLKKAIRQEMGVSRIVCLDNLCLDNFGYTENGVHFNVTEASCMAFVCLVENTEEEKCQVLYSPLTDADTTEKSVVIDTCSVCRHLWTSLIPFTSKKDRPASDVARCGSQNIVRDGVSCQKTLLVKNNTIIFDNIQIKSEKTKKI